MLKVNQEIVVKEKRRYHRKNISKEKERKNQKLVNLYE